MQFTHIGVKQGAHRTNARQKPRISGVFAITRLIVRGGEETVAHSWYDGGMNTQHDTATRRDTASKGSVIEMVFLALSAALIAFALSTELADGARIWLLLLGPLWLPVSLVAVIIRIRRGHVPGMRAATRYVKDAVYLGALFVSCYYTALLASLFFGSFS